jgi:DNA-binding HxlR family transcriptional regulator
MAKTARDMLDLFSETCSLPAALEVVGERWAFLILRGAFAGLRYFEDFQQSLGIARNILSDRLNRFVDHGIMERRPVPDDRRRVEYRLTDKGHALTPALVALRQWGAQWETGVPAKPVLVDARDGLPVREVTVQAHDGRVLRKGDMRWAAEAGEPH